MKSMVGTMPDDEKSLQHRAHEEARRRSDRAGHHATLRLPSSPTCLTQTAGFLYGDNLLKPLRRVGAAGSTALLPRRARSRGHPGLRARAGSPDQARAVVRRSTGARLRRCWSASSSGISWRSAPSTSGWPAHCRQHAGRAGARRSATDFLRRAYRRPARGRLRRGAPPSAARGTSWAGCWAGRLASQHPTMVSCTRRLLRHLLAADTERGTGSRRRWWPRPLRGPPASRRDPRPRSPARGAGLGNNVHIRSSPRRRAPALAVVGLPQRSLPC